MQKHTKGPWAIEQCRDEFEVYPVKDGPPKLGRWAEVATVSGNYETEAEANARLIAASPKLLSIAKRWAALDGGSWNIDRHAREKAELLDFTRSVIIKIEGRLP